MGGASLPPGFRFHPTDEELVGYYLHRKVQGLEIELEVIPVIELYKFDPWELPGQYEFYVVDVLSGIGLWLYYALKKRLIYDTIAGGSCGCGEKSFLPKRDMEWFFFCPRDRKYPNGTRTNRATKAGYWKATGKDRKVVCQSSVTGYKKTLVFYRGRAPLGDRTDWLMHEYRLFDESSQSQGTPSFQGAYALCRVIKKNEQAHKASDSHGESKAKRIGSSSSIGDLTAAEICDQPLGISADVPSQRSYPCNESRYSSPIASPFQVPPFAEYEHASIGSNPSNIRVSPDLILDSSKDYPQAQEAVSGYFPLHDYYMDSIPQGYMSPYLGNEDYMDLCGNQDASYHDYDYANTF